MMKLSYFPVRGRVEPARLMLELRRVEYVFVGIAPETWRTPEGKARMFDKTPFGQLPVLEDGEIALCQSHAIDRHIARKLGLAGDTPAEQARVDEVTETAYELLSDLTSLFWDSQFDERRPKHLDASRDRLQRLDAYFTRVGADDSHWVSAGKPTLADAVMAYALESVMPLHPGLLETFPKLLRSTTALFALDGVGQYARSDRRPRCWTVARARFGGKPEETHHWS